MKHQYFLKSFTSLIALSAVTVSSSYAAEIDEVIVTAQRKATNLQTTPIAVTSLSEADLERLQITELSDIDLNVPGLAIDSNIASSTALNILMRGASEPSAAFLFSEPGIGLYMNGTYRRLSAGNVELADIERVEVARGPQGTLFGRNTLAGAINIVTRRPSQETYGSFTASYDTFDTTYIKGVIGGGLSDNLSASVSALYKDRATGPFDNQYNGKDVGKKNFGGIQGNALYEFNEGGDIFVSAYWSEDDSDGVYGSPLNVTTDEFVFNAPDVFASSSTIDGVEPASQAKQTGFDAALTKPINDNLTFKYIGSFNETESYWAVDFVSGGVAAPAPGDCTGLSCTSEFFRVSDGDQSQFSHELQLLGEHGRYDWIVGAYYFDEKTDQILQDDFGGFKPAPANYNLESDSIAIFGQLSVDLTDKLIVTAGGRYTEDSKDFSGTISGVDFSTRPSWSEFTGKLGLDYQYTDDVLLYASWNQGFKSGTFNPFSPAPFIETPLEPETVDSYELGIKSQMLDDSLRVNLALFNADYTDLVVGGLGAQGLFTANGGETNVLGLEGETIWAVNDSFDAFLTFNYLFDYEWDDTSGSLDTRVGDVLPYARELQYSIGGTYTHDLGDNGDLVVSALVSYNGENYSIANHLQNPVNLVDDVTVLNLGFVYTLENPQHQVFLNGNNVTDTESYYRVGNFSGITGNNTASILANEGSSWELGYRFKY